MSPPPGRSPSPRRCARPAASTRSAAGLTPGVNGPISRPRGFRPVLSTRMPLDIAYSVCPHDCPSACALAVDRIDLTHIGRVRGADGQSYTQGVVCAKVGRYAERQHHPERLSVPLRRVGGKGRRRDAFVPISWDDALDEVAEKLTRAAQLL